jgi:hypothetical protein
MSMPFGTLMPEGPGRGTHKRNGRMITVQFDHDTFNQLRNRAIAEKTSFSEQVRLLVEWGLESVAATDE